MSAHPVIEQLAQLVRDEPSITVAELARKMGYAEQKSVYYWLEKAGFRSIRLFRDAVLTGRFPPDTQVPQWPARFRDSDETFSPGTLPLMAITTPGVVRKQGMTIQNVLSDTLSPAGYSIVLATDDYVPLLIKGDLLLIEPGSEPSNGALALVWIPTKQTTGVYRHHRLSPAGPSRFYHPVTGQEQTDDIAMLGLVMGSLRMFAPSVPV